MQIGFAIFHSLAIQIDTCIMPLHDMADEATLRGELGRYKLLSPIALQLIVNALRLLVCNRHSLWNVALRRTVRDKLERCQ